MADIDLSRRKKRRGGTKDLLSTALAALYCGDFSFRLRLCDGVSQEVAESFNDLAERLDHSALELARLTRVVGRDGEMGERMRMEGLRGGWETIGDSFNTLIGDKSKDVFLATLSHELRTPLHAIVGWTDMMRNGQVLPDELGRAIETIDRNAHALNHLVEDLLDVSRIVTGSLKIDSKLVGLASVVEAAIEGGRPQCTARRVTLDVRLERVGCVKGDAGRLRQVIGNLLSNAIKFTPNGGVVTVLVTREGKSGKVVVQDSGEGITSALLPHVFERFRQAENATARGLGLGLAIVKYLVGEHGGTVEASSEGLGKGSAFTVLLPIAVEEANAADQDLGGASVLVSAQPQLAGVHALVVEDDPDGNELITTILERYGARVTSVGTAAAALDALDAERPDILISDIGLPDSDGIELIKMVRTRAFATSMPAIALTAYASRQDAAKAIAAGFDAHVAKPVQPATLGAAVERLIASGRENVKASQSEA